VLLGLLRGQEGVAVQVLMNLGLKLEDVRKEVLNLLPHLAIAPKSPMDAEYAAKFKIHPLVRAYLGLIQQLNVTTQ